MPDLPQAGPLATLGIAAGPRYGEQIPVPVPVVTVGRAAGCEVVIDDDSVSAKHARLEYDLGAWRITDLGSTNGTAVEGTKLAPNLATPLPYGATIRLGGVQLQFREADGADVDAAAAGYVPPEAPRTLREERTGARFPLWLVLLVLLIAAVIGMIVYTNYARSIGAPVPAAAPAPASASAPSPRTP